MTQDQTTTDPRARLRAAAAKLRESEILAVEVNDPPDSRCRELWPMAADTLVAWLETTANVTQPDSLAFLRAVDFASVVLGEPKETPDA